MHLIWKIYTPIIPSKIWNHPATSLLIGWIDNVNQNLIIASYVIDPIQLTNDDNKRTFLLQQLEVINKANNENKNNFKCMIIGSTNIAKYDCSDLMRIYKINAWLQFDKELKLNRVLSLNKDDINDYYIIQYHPTDSTNILSPYYNQNIPNNSSYHQILRFCNESINIHSYLHQSSHDQNQSNTSFISSCFCHLLCQYFEALNLLYGLFYLFVVYSSPLFILSDCRIIQELSLNNKKFGKIIQYLKKSNSKTNGDGDQHSYNNNDCNDIDKKHKTALDIWSDIIQYFINIGLGIIFGYFLYFYINEELQYISKYLKWFDYNSIKSHISWLMGIPYGLKLNTNLNDVFGKLSLLCLEIVHVQIPYALKLNNNGYDDRYFLSIWDVFDVNEDSKMDKMNKMHLSFSLSDAIIMYLPMIKIYLSILSCCFGITFMIAFINDMVSFLSLPFEILHKFFLLAFKFETKMLSICGKLFRGLKYNQLKHRVDKCVFDTDQLFIGIILFSIFVFLLPTIVVYFIYFSVTIIFVWTFQLILDIIQITIHYLSITSFIILLVKPKFICNGFDVCIDAKKHNVIQLNTKSCGIIGYFNKIIKHNIMTNINKDIPHKRFVYSLKINMY